MKHRPRFSARVRSAWTAAGIPAGFSVRAATTDAPAEIMLYDEIGFWGVTAKDFAGAMQSAGAGPLTVRINSPGGECFDGMAIYNMLASRPGGVTCVVDGVAASAASYIALAGDRTVMAEASVMMIHNSWTVAIGDRNELTATAAALGKLDGIMNGIYSGKTGMSADGITALLDAETWYTAAEAKAAGLVDEVAAPSRTAAKGATAVKAVAIRVALRAAFDPDGDGDDDVAEAIAAILAARDSLGDALSALTGAPDSDDSETMDSMARQKSVLRARIALAA